MAPKTQATTTKTDSVDIIQIQILCSSQETIKKGSLIHRMEKKFTKHSVIKALKLTSNNNSYNSVIERLI